MLYIELFKKKIIKQLYNADCLNGVYHYEFIYKFESNKLKGNLYMVSPRNKTFFFLKKNPESYPKTWEKGSLGCWLLDFFSSGYSDAGILYCAGAFAPTSCYRCFVHMTELDCNTTTTSCVWMQAATSTPFYCSFIPTFTK